MNCIFYVSNCDVNFSFTDVNQYGLLFTHSTWKITAENCLWRA